ncbi:c [Asticcacaulis biprosthecium C19]|uniref:C n=1 Tax=Asticcacaulis biprosthecium C19 TaxID=715226 RepID=F4QLG4_9CAUL|nr:AAA family ATPase [Asticcacaulis biprosthecium]EGF92309.1 c [Asticcacaulis biprosthecium C19] [Asticcacaulis biprosthecium C19]
MPRCIVIAGPNGAGKTTFALKYLPRAGVETFLNADMIASGLSPFAPEKQAAAAGRLFLEQIEICISEGRDFAFETTLSGRAYLRMIERLQASGWTVELIYLALPSADMSIQRVAERVAHGGHHIPTADIQRRYPRSLRNLLNDYSMKVDECHCYLNTEFLTHPVFQRYGETLVVRDHDVYRQLERLAGLN